MEQPYVRKPYERERVITTVEGESATDTQYGNDTDVNKIVARFSRTGQWPDDAGVTQGEFCDVTDLQGDLTAILERGKDALAEIEKLKAKQSEDNKAQAEENRKLADEYRKLRESAEQNLAPKEPE